MSSIVRHPIEDIRRLLVDLGSAAGLERAKASLWARQVLWFEATGEGRGGLESVPGTLERLGSRDLDPRAEPRFRAERAGAATLVAGRCLPGLALARAGEVAMQKSREVGQGVARLSGVDAGVATEWVAADLAIGPFLASIRGPGGASVTAWPTPSGLPLLRRSEGAATESGFPLEADEVMVVVEDVHALEPIETYYARLARTGLLEQAIARPGWLTPDVFQTRRLAVERGGLPVGEAAAADLGAWAARLRVKPLEPVVTA